MLIIFTISISPKRYLHDIFANHNDTISLAVNDGKLQLSEAGYNCDCNNLVATSPFMDEAVNIVVICPTIYPAFFVAFSNPLHSTSYSFTELRGPPAVG